MLPVAVTSADADAFNALEDWFDVVVVDAPCSGEGLFRKDHAAIREWSLPHVETCALRQQRILPGAVNALAPGGVLLYSTCTYNRLENEDNVAWLCQTFDLEPVSIDIPASWGVHAAREPTAFSPSFGRRGFFLSILRKRIPGAAQPPQCCFSTPSAGSQSTTAATFPLGGQSRHPYILPDQQR
ncbi:MAG: hypothetical protein IPL65_12690 [Lewinellaceae bacterium]|nr:hypothetical protein [Lewinellaceae bacterium]